MHTTVHPCFHRAARWPAISFSRKTLRLFPRLPAALPVARALKCFSTSIASRSRLPSLRFTDLQEDGESPTLHEIIQLSPLASFWGQAPDVWIHRLEHFLPADLRSAPIEAWPIAEPTEALRVRRGLLHCLTAAQNLHHFDLLTHLGLSKQRWDVVAWVVKEVALGHRQFGSLEDDVNTTGIQWSTHGGLDQLTTGPIQEAVVVSDPNTSVNLTRSSRYVSDPRMMDKRLQHAGLGQIWRSMGQLILEASKRPAEESHTIMSHVLAMMAHLHHGDIVPASVYKHVPDQSYTLQPPPILHMFSSRIMTALSEAAWNAHQVSASAVFGDTEQYQQPLFGTQLPGTRYGSQVEALSLEVWLELVLWSCLHGGWVVDGLAVLKVLQEQTGVDEWSLVCWKQALQKYHLDTQPSDSFTWKDLMDVLEGAGPQTHRDSNDQLSIARTISSGTVAAYADALTNEIYTGVGERGISANDVVSHLKRLKGLLDKQKLGLGNATWDAMVQRLAESNGVLIERDPSLMLEILELVQPYGTETESNSIPTNNESGITSLPYFFETSASTLGLFHRILQAHINIGGVDRTLSSLRALQEYTDRNQRRSIERFFQELKEKRNSDASPSRGAGFFSVDYPAFFPQIPVDVLGSMMDLFTEAGLSTSAIQLLQSNDPAGPIIPESFLQEPALAPALVRYATSANDKSMLEKVISSQGSMTMKREAAIPRPVLTALLASQISRRRWDSVHSVLSAATDGSATRQFAYTRWHPSLACYLACELLRIQGKSERSLPQNDRDDQSASTKTSDLSRASEIFGKLLKGDYGRINPRTKLVIDGDLRTANSLAMVDSILGVLASVNPAWAWFCLPLFQKTGNLPLTLDISHFNIILQGLVDGYNASAGRALCQQWCVSVLNLPAEHRRPGGVYKMSPVRPSSVRDPFSHAWSVQVPIPRPSRAKLRFYGRLMPNLTTVRIVLRRAFEDEANERMPYQETIDWVVHMLNGLGYRGKEAENEILRAKESVEWRLALKQGESGA